MPTEKQNKNANCLPIYDPINETFAFPHVYIYKYIYNLLYY